MTDEQALLAAIAANPDDDTVRLAYADWLNEHGCPRRAEFIRVQIRLHRRAIDNQVSEAWRAREYALHQTHAAEWLRDLPAGFEGLSGFRRGFPYRGRATVSAVLSARDDPRVWLLDTLTLSVETPHARPREAVDCPAVMRLTDLVVQGDLPIGFGGVRALADGDFPRLERLSLAGQWIRDAGLRMLCESWGFPRLRVLDLDDNRITDEGLKMFAGSHLIRKLRWLSLGRNEVSREAVRRLHDSFPGVVFGVGIF